MPTPSERRALQQLPAHPSIEHLKKEAKQLSKEQPSLSLQQVQHQLAQSYGLRNWDELLEHVETLNRPANGSSASPKKPTLPAASRIHREGSKVWIEPVPKLAYRKTGQSAVIGSLAAALSVLEANPPSLITPFERVVQALPPSTGPAWDYNSLMGDSAMAFRVRWHRRGGGRQTSEKPATWWAFTMAYAGSPEDEALLERSTGWTFTTTPYHYPNNAKPTEYWPWICASVDAGLPLVAVLPEDFGIIHGYDLASAQVLATGYDPPLSPKWISISEVGTKVTALTDPVAPISRLDASVAALHTTVANWSRGHVAPVDAGNIWEDAKIRIQYGAAAYDEWADDLRHAEMVAERSRKQLRNASVFNMSCLTDARWAAVGYLHSVSPFFSENARLHLANAAAIYERLARQTMELANGKGEFFGVWNGEPLETWTSELREREAQILMQCRDLDAAAVQEIQQEIVGYQPPIPDR